MLRTAVRRTNLSALARPAQVNCLAGSVFRRTYADAPKTENLKLSFSVPHMSIFVNKEVYFHFMLRF